MPHSEFVNWIKFLNARPPGWRDDQRSFLLLKQAGFKGKATDLFPALVPVYNKQLAEEGMNTPMPTGKFLAMLSKAKGGDKEAEEMFS